MGRGAALALTLAVGLAGPAAAVTVEDGLSVYRQFCSHCHGIDMVNPGTSSFDLRRFPRDQRDRFEAAVLRGRGSMPAWGDILRPEELEAVWLYVATRGGKEPPPDDSAAAAPDAGSGSAPTAPVEETGALEGLRTPGRLAVCLDRNGGAMSALRADGGRGLDYALAAALAERLGLALDVVWFEGAPSRESDPVRETYAMLALGLCDAVPGHALIEGATGEPPTDRAAPPLWLDMPTEWRLEGRDRTLQRRTRPYVDLEPVAATRPYVRVEIGVAFAPGVAPRAIGEVADLEGLRVGVEQGTLSGALTLAQATPALRAASVTAPPGPKFLWRLEAGAFDAALVSVPAYDFHRIQNPLSGVTLGDWRHPMGFNLAFAALARNVALRAALDGALAEFAAEGRVERLAVEAGVHFAPPRAPETAPRLTLADLAAIR